MIILRHRLTGDHTEIEDNKPYNGHEWEAVSSTTLVEIDLMEKTFEEEGLLLGDAIAIATKSLGFEPCSGCTRRQQWLNEFHQKGRKFIKDLVGQLKELGG